MLNLWQISQEDLQKRCFVFFLCLLRQSRLDAKEIFSSINIYAVFCRRWSWVPTKFPQHLDDENRFRTACFLLSCSSTKPWCLISVIYRQFSSVVRLTFKKRFPQKAYSNNNVGDFFQASLHSLQLFLH